MTIARHPGLDAVRAVACLLVIALHAMLLAGNAVYSPAYESALWWLGQFGVDLFFALSGYLITGILLDDLGKPAYFRVFYARRALRILPLYYSTCVLAFIVFRPWLSIDPWYQYLSSNQAWWWFHGVNLFRGLYGGHGWPYLNHFWSLGIEEQFYLCWPAVVYLLRQRLPLACLAVLGASPLLRGWMQDRGCVYDPWMIVHYDGLAAGALLAWAVRNVPMKRVAWTVGVGAALGALALALGAPWTVELTSKAAVATGLVLAGSMLTRVPAWLVWIGQRSYCLYVAHFPVQLALQPHWHQLASRVGNHLAYFDVTLAITCVIAELSWRLIEAPLLAFKPAHPPIQPEVIVPVVKPATTEIRGVLRGVLRKNR